MLEQIKLEFEKLFKLVSQNEKATNLKLNRQTQIIRKKLLYLKKELTKQKDVQ